MKKSPAAPPAYRPLPQPRVLQRKTATAPNVYRPQPLPKVLQRKTAGAPQIVAPHLRSNTIQGVLIITDDDNGYFDSNNPVPADVNKLSSQGKSVLNSKSNKSKQSQIIAQLNQWSATTNSEYEFKTWQLAAQAALKPADVKPTKTYKDDIGTVGEGYTEEKKPLPTPTPTHSDRRQEILDPLLAQVVDYEKANTTSHGGQHQSLSRAMSLTATAMERKELLESTSQPLSKKEKKREKVKIRHIEETAKRKEGPHNQGGGKGQFS